MSYRILTDAPLPPQIIEMMNAAGCEHALWAREKTDQALLESAEGFLVYGHPIIDGAVMATMPNLRVISNFGVGVDHIDLETAKERDIPVGNTPGFVDGATADMTFTLLMAAARNMIIGDRHARSPEFTHYDANILHGQEVFGSTLGIVGMGRIGKEVARRASGFDMTVLYHNRNRDLDAERELGVSYAPLADLLRQSDFVTLNVPMTDETYHMIGHAEANRRSRERGAGWRGRSRSARRGTAEQNNLGCGHRRNRARAAAAGSSAANHGQSGDCAPPGKRHGTNATGHGPAHGGQSGGRAEGRGAVESGGVGTMDDGP
jgi:lactate dehydrogenase-like 2-hydroxyacid dehydrogenase